MHSSLKITASALATALLLAGCASQQTAPTASAPSEKSVSAPAVAAAPAISDAELASKLKGQWVGQWTIGNFGGKFVLVVTSVEGTNLKGEGQWYGTANGDTKEALSKAVVVNGELVAAQSGGTTFKLKLKNEKTLDGSWALTGYTGPLTATRQ